MLRNNKIAINLTSKSINDLKYRLQGKDSDRGNRIGIRLRDVKEGAGNRKSMPMKSSMGKKEIDFVGIDEQYYHFRNYNNVSQKSLNANRKPFVLDGLKISESQKVLGPHKPPG
jgi:hypothetical protein